MVLENIDPQTVHSIRFHMVHFQEIEPSIETLSKFDFLRKLELDQTMLENVQQINRLARLTLNEISITEKDNAIWNCGIFPQYLVYRLRDLKVFNNRMISEEERNASIARFHAYSSLASRVPLSQLLQDEHLLYISHCKERLDLVPSQRNFDLRDVYDSDDDDGYRKSCSPGSCSSTGI